MIRLLFNRKNKTLRSVLHNKSTIKLLESNMRTHAAVNNQMLDDAVKVEDIVEEVVSMKQFQDQRSGKMDLDDFLELLAEFNKRGIHFA